MSLRLMHSDSITFVLNIFVSFVFIHTQCVLHVLRTDRFFVQLYTHINFFHWNFWKLPPLYLQHYWLSLSSTKQVSRAIRVNVVGLRVHSSLFLSIAVHKSSAGGEKRQLTTFSNNSTPTQASKNTLRVSNPWRSITWVLYDSQYRLLRCLMCKAGTECILDSRLTRLVWNFPLMVYCAEHIGLNSNHLHSRQFVFRGWSSVKMNDSYLCIYGCKSLTAHSRTRCL